MKFYNRTRTAASIPEDLKKQGQWHLLPFYYLAQLSFLGQEAINHSGSYRFADHVYAGRPKGDWGIGYLLDAIFLHLPSARSMRNRYLHAKEELMRAIEKRRYEEQIHVLALPIGLGRELFELDEHFALNDTSLHRKIHWHGYDLDSELIARHHERAHERMHFINADAFDAEVHSHPYDAIVSLGFGEFIDDEQLVDFYRHVHEQLKPGGYFITSGMKKHVVSDYLMRNLAQLHTNYRDGSHLSQLHNQAGFSDITIYSDNVGLQTMAISIKNID